MKKISKLIKLLSLNSCLKTGRLVIICLFLFKNNSAQNLINNRNFENYTEDLGTSHCVTNFSSMFNWQQIFSPDIFVKPCTFANHYGVPNNTFGCSYPKNGNAYIGIASYYKTAEVKEYIYQYINNPLIAGKSYYVSFYASLADMTGYAIKNIGANLSVTQPTVVANPYISANPQVVNQSGFLNDTTGWTKIEGYFTAQGGEQYITIGNFNSNANTDTLFQGTTNPLPSDPGMAYYYIDSVSLYDSLDYVTNVLQIKNNISLSIFPNPAQDKIQVKIENLKEGNITIKITDVLGREIKQIEYEEEIDISDLEKGIYFLSLSQSGKLIGTRKIIKQ